MAGVKRFRWPLQKLLDVTERQEGVLRAELVSLAVEMEAVARQMDAGRTALSEALAGVAALSLDERLRRQAAVTAWAQQRQADLAAWQRRLEEVAAQRQEVMQRFIVHRAKRQRLEKLRDEARRTHQAAANRQEQKELEEAARAAAVSRAATVTEA